jgi:hypothetical protein
MLLFFVMAFSPAAPEGQINFALPVRPGVVPGEVVRAPAPAPKPQLRWDLTITIRARRDGVYDGDISALSVEDSLGRRTALDSVAALRMHLKKLRVARQNAGAVSIQGDGRLRVVHLLAVIDACKAAGFRDVRLHSPGDNGP